MHPLIQQIRTLAKRARHLTLARGFALWFSVVLVAIALAGVADFVFRFREMPLRWMALLTVLTAGAVGWRRFVSPALRMKWSDLYVARRVELSYPDFGERLSNAIAFLHEPTHDARYGSSTLRSDVIDRVASMAARKDLSNVIDPDFARPAMKLLLVVAITAGALIASDQSSSWLAMRRLALPWRDEAWPRRNELTFLDAPELLPYGDDFEIKLIDANDRLPDQVSIWYWFDGDPESSARSHAMVLSGGKMTHRVSAVTESFKFRATGGDHLDMAWQTVRVVVPPRIVHSRIRLFPPKYTGRDTETAERQIRAFEGTTVEIDVRFNRPVKAASVVFEAAERTVEFPATVTANGRSAKLSSEPQPWVLERSGTYGWQITDDAGLTVIEDDHTVVEVIPDLPPVISTEFPPAEASFTAQARIPLRFLVKDDLAINDVKLRTHESHHMLLEASAASHDNRGSAKNTLAVEHLWDLATINDLKPGAQLAFEAIATDYRPQNSQPANGTIRVISTEEFLRRIDERQAQLLERFKAALQLQRTLQQQTSQLAVQLKSQQQLSDDDAAIWPALDPGQRRVTELLGGNEGARWQLEQLIRDLKINQQETESLTTHLSSLASELNAILDDLIPPVQSSLSKAERLLRFDNPEYTAVASEWTAAASGEERIVAALESLVDRLSHWDRFQNLSHEVRQLLDEQMRLASELVTAQTLGKDLSQLSPEERSRLAKAAQRLNELAAHIDRLQSRVEQIQQRLDGANPEASQFLNDALNVLQNKPIAGDLRDAAAAAAENKLGNAQRDLQKSEEGLRELLQALERSPQPSSAAIEELLLKRIAGIAARQKSLLEESMNVMQQGLEGNTLADTSKRLADVQKSLAKEVTDFRQQTAADSPYAMALDLAVTPMQRAGDRLSRNEVDEPTVRLERAALSFLTDLMNSFENESSAEQPMEPQSPEETEDAGAEGEQPLSLAQLKVIRLMQLELLRRTVELDKSQSGPRERSEEQTRELEDLAIKQKELAEWIEEATKAGDRPGPVDNQKQPAIEMRNEDGSGKNESGIQDKQSGTRSSNSIRSRVHDIDRFVFVAFQAPPSQPPLQSTAEPKQPSSKDQNDDLNRALLEDLPASRPAGEDLGQPSEQSPWRQLSRQMREAETQLRAGDAAARTQQLQRRVAAQLSELIEQIQKQQSESPSSQAQATKTEKPNSEQSDSEPSQKNDPNNGSGESNGSRGQSQVGQQESVANWARRAWGTLPDRVREQIQSLSDEQFLPEYEAVIRQYYDRLSEEGRSQ